jgi:hypothetical protein
MKYAFNNMPAHVLDECRESFVRRLVGDLLDPYSMIRMPSIPRAPDNNAGRPEDQEML